MKKNLMTFILLCVANIGFAQLEVSNVGNASIGNVSPLLDAKLRLYSSTPTTSTYGLHSFLENTNVAGSPGSSLYGAYFYNKQKTLGGMNSLGRIYGVCVDNDIAVYNGESYGFYVDNKFSNGIGDIYGLYAKNTGAGSSSMAIYGAYLNNTNTSQSSGLIYGLYSTVSGGSVNNRYAGFFTGGKVVVNGDIYGLDIYSHGSLINSDERLKSDIKPLTDEKEKLYLLQGKSYKKTPSPVLTMGLVEDSLAEKKEEIIIETPEYGYLAQELEKVFPDLVKQDSAGYYAVNYIGLIPVIVEALKDQKLEIEKQQEQIKQLVKLLDIKSINEKDFEENGIESIPLLLQNTPNPFNQATEIGYYIPASVNSANIYIYDVTGFQQRNISISERGKGATILQASALQAGIYFYTLICDGKPVDTKQMILTR